MFHLIQLEWKKFSKSLAFRLLITAYTILLPAILLAGKRLKDLPPPINSNEVFYIFPTVWQYLGYIGNWLTFFFLGFLSVLLVTMEYNYKTLRQNIITGLNRNQYYWSKIQFIFVISLFATLYYFLCGMTIGLINTEAIYFNKVFQYSDYFGRYMLMCFGYMSIGMLIGVLIKRTGIALFVYLSYFLFLEPVLRYGVHFYLTRHKSMLYYPANAVGDLIPPPFSELAREFTEEFGFEFFLSPTLAVTISSMYLLLILGIAYRKIIRSDL